MKPLLAIINVSTKTPDTAFPPVIAALQKQVSGDFAPIWNLDATLVFVPKGGKAPNGSWQVACGDNIDAVGALGYHDVTSQDQPLGKVGIQTTIQDNGRWEVTLGHEVLEMLADPDIIQCTFAQISAKQSVIIAHEVCDAPEEKSYLIDGVPMTDFVTPQWFEPGRSGVPFTFLKSVSSPLTLAPGGYIGIYRINGGGWSQITARKESYGTHQGNVLMLADMESGTDVESYSKLPKVGSRRERRRRMRTHWVRSLTD